MGVEEFAIPKVEGLIEPDDVARTCFKKQKISVTAMGNSRARQMVAIGALNAMSRFL
jgi:hypothetical protein